MGISGQQSLIECNSASRRAVFLDRDGVINHAEIRNGLPFPPKSVKQLSIIPGVGPALQALRDAGWLLIVVTNQPDVARGKTSRESVEAINNYLQSHLPIDEIRTCYHDDSDGCYCRKPLPGALLEAAESNRIDLARSYMIGDRWRDVEAGLRAGCKTVFLDYGYNEQQPHNYNHCVTSLAEAADIILEEK